MNIVDRCRGWHKPGEAITGDVQLYLDAANEIERLCALKTPATRQLLDITKGCLDHCEAENAKLNELCAERLRWIQDRQIEISKLRAENDDLKAALDVWNSSELGLMIAKLRADSINLKTAYGELYNADALIAKLRAALERCIPYIEGRVGDPIAIVEQATAALTNEQKP